MADLTVVAEVDTFMAAATTAAMRTAIGLGSVENTALSTWAGSTNITTVGTIGTGTWSGSFGAVSGANLTTLNASNISSGTLAATRFPTCAITSGTIAGLTGLGIRSTGAAFDLTLATSEAISAGRTLSFNVGNADRTLTIPATGTVALLGTANAFTVANTTTLTSLGTTPTDGFSLINSTAAANNAQQYSPSMVWQGNGWKTTATAASQTASYRAYVQTTQGSTAPYGTWMLQQSINGGAYSGGLELAADGARIAHLLVRRYGTASHNYSWNIAADTVTVENRFNDVNCWVWNSSEYIIAPPSGTFAFASTAGDSIRSTDDTYITRKTTAAVQLGINAASPISQIFSACGARIGTDTNTSSTSTLTIAGPHGTGTGTGGSLILATYAAGSSGTAINTLTTRLTIDNAGTSTFSPSVNVSPIVVSGVTNTTSAPIFDLAQTWNNGATTFTAIKLNVTNTSSAGSNNVGTDSMLIDFQVGGASKANIDKAGQFFSLTQFAVMSAMGGNRAVRILNNSGDGYLIVNSTGRIGFGSSDATAYDTYMVRDAAGVIAQKNSTNAQALRIYGTTTGPKYVSLAHDGTNAILTWSGGGQFRLPGLPTSDPGVSGALYTSAGVVMVST